MVDLVAARTDFLSLWDVATARHPMSLGCSCASEPQTREFRYQSPWTLLGHLRKFSRFAL